MEFIIPLFLLIIFTDYAKIIIGDGMNKTSVVRDFIYKNKRTLVIIFLIAIFFGVLFITLKPTWSANTSTINLTDAQNVLKSVAIAYRNRGSSIQYNDKYMTLAEFDKNVRRNGCYFSPEDATSQDRRYFSCSPLLVGIYYEAFGPKIHEVFNSSNSNVFINWAVPSSTYFNSQIAVYNVSIYKNGEVVNDKKFADALDDSNYTIKSVIYNSDGSTTTKTYSKNNNASNFRNDVLNDMDNVLQPGDIIGYKYTNSVGSHVLMYFDYDKTYQGTEAEKKKKKLFIHSWLGDYYYTTPNDEKYYLNKIDRVYANGNTKIWAYRIGDYGTDKTNTLEYRIFGDKPNTENGEVKSNIQISIIRPLNALVGNSSDKYAKNVTNRVAEPTLVREMTSSVSKYESVNPTDTITYTINLKNQNATVKLGNSKISLFMAQTYENLNIKATLPTNTEFVSCSPNCVYTSDFVKWSNFAINATEEKEFKYTVKVKSGTSLGTEIVNSGTEVAGITMNTIKTTVNKTLTKSMQSELVKFVNQKVENNQYYGSSRVLIDAAYKAIGITGFSFLSTTNNTVNADIIFNAFFEPASTSGNYYFRSSLDSSNQFVKMYVKNLFGGYNVASHSYSSFSETNSSYTVACQQKSDGRVKTFDNSTLMVGDVLLIYDSKYAEEIKQAAIATQNKNEYIQISSVKDFYLYLGDGKFATVSLYKYSDSKVKLIAADDLKAQIFTNSTNYESGTSRSRLLDSLLGQNAFVVLRPSYAYDGTIDLEKPKITVDGATRTNWQNSQTFKFKLSDAGGLSAGEYNIKYKLYKKSEGTPTCEDMSNSIKINVDSNGLKEATSTNIIVNSGVYDRIAFCNTNQVSDIFYNTISANTRSYDWKMLIDSSKPTIDIVSDSASTLLPSQTFKIRVSDEGSGLKQGSTYTIKYAYGDENDNYTCNSSVMSNNVLTLSVPDGNTVYEVVSDSITIDSGTSSKIYLCNVNSIEDNGSNRKESGITSKTLMVGTPKISFGLLDNPNPSVGITDITDRKTYASSQTFRFYLYTDSSGSGFVAGNYNIKYKLYKKSDATPKCAEMTDSVTITATDGQTGMIYANPVTISSGSYDYIAFCNDNIIHDKTKGANNDIAAGTLKTGFKMLIDNTNPKSALVSTTRDVWQKQQTFSFKLIDEGSGLKEGEYKLKYKLYNGDTIPKCSEMTDEVSINVDSDGTKEEYSDEITISADDYKYVAWCNSVKVLDVVGNSREVGNIYSHSAMKVDNTNPISTVSSTNNLKSTTQTATLKCSDNNEIVSYYWGVGMPTSSAYIDAPADLINGTGISKNISSAGKYYLSCKDFAGNVSTESVEYYSYTIDNKLLKTNGIIGKYDSDNYDTVSKNDYLTIAGTSLPLEDIYTIPNYSNATKFAGTSYGDSASEDEEGVYELQYDAILLNSDNTYYAMWFNRNVVNIEYNMNGGTLSNHAINYSSDNEGYILNNDSRIIQTLSYGASFSNGGLYNYNGSYFKITNAGYTAKSPQWCLDPSNNATCFNQDVLYTANNLCSYANDDCTITLYVNWQEGEEVSIVFDDLIVNDEEKIINRLLSKMKVSQFLSKITTNGIAKVVDENNNDVDNDHIITCKDKLIVTYDDEEFIYTFRVLGDVNRDGNINISDAYILAMYIIDGNSNLPFEDLLLGDINNDGLIKMNDVVLLLNLWY